MKETVENNQIATDKVDLFRGFSVDVSSKGALGHRHVVKEAQPVLHESGKKKGQPVLKKNGEAKMTAPQDYTVVSMLNLEAAKGKPSIKTNTGLSGQDLFDFEAQAQRDANLAFLVMVTEAIQSGTYDFRRARVNNRNGVISSTMRPARERLIQVVSEEQALKVLGITKEQYDAIKAKLAKQVS